MHSTAETLLYRNQFILGPSFIHQFESWKKLTFGKSLNLTVHPALNVSQATHGQISIRLLGFIIDPESPDATDSWGDDRHNRTLANPGLQAPLSGVGTLAKTIERRAEHWQKAMGLML